MHQTPSSFRFIRGKLEEVEEEQTFVHKNDQTIVIVWLKYYIGSSRSVRASDLPTADQLGNSSAL